MGPAYWPRKLDIAQTPHAHMPISTRHRSTQNHGTLVHMHGRSLVIGTHCRGVVHETWTRTGHHRGPRHVSYRCCVVIRSLGRRASDAGKTQAEVHTCKADTCGTPELHGSMGQVLLDSHRPTVSNDVRYIMIPALKDVAQGVEIDLRAVGLGPEVEGRELPWYPSTCARPEGSTEQGCHARTGHTAQGACANDRTEMTSSAPG